MFEEGKKIVITTTYPKDTLTKTGMGRMSHLDKVKTCELPLYVNGVKQEI